MSTTHNRSSPSKRYRELTALYERMHVEGEVRLGLPPENTFAGTSLPRHIAGIKRLIDATGAKTVLDYGSGKGTQYRPQKVVVDGTHVADGIAEYWDVDEVRCYDPGYAPYRELPSGDFDGVVCTDVLEHLPEEDLGWVLDEILRYATRFAYLNVACFPAGKTLPDGSNAHATVRAPEWWADLVRLAAARRPGLRWELHAAFREGDGVREKVFGNEVLDASTTGIDLEGRRALFYTPNEMTKWRARSLYTKEPVTIEWLRAMPSGTVFADVGANVGMYTVFAAFAREAQVYAFEPESGNYAILNRNLRLNGLGERVVAFCAGLADLSGLSRLYLSAAEAGGSGHSLGEEVGFDLAPRKAAFTQGCIAFSLDELVQAGHMPCPQYVKIDVDGFEHKVIRGMQASLRSGVRSMLVELNPALAEHRAIRQHLETLGFSWDPQQVTASTRACGTFAGVAEHVFRR